MAIVVCMIIFNQIDYNCMEVTQNVLEVCDRKNMKIICRITRKTVNEVIRDKNEVQYSGIQYIL